MKTDFFLKNILRRTKLAGFDGLESKKCLASFDSHTQQIKKAAS